MQKIIRTGNIFMLCSILLLGSSESVGFFSPSYAKLTGAQSSTYSVAGKLKKIKNEIDENRAPKKAQHSSMDVLNQPNQKRKRAELSDAVVPTFNLKTKHPRCKKVGSKDLTYVNPETAKAFHPDEILNVLSPLAKQIYDKIKALHNQYLKNYMEEKASLNAQPSITSQALEERNTKILILGNACGDLTNGLSCLSSYTESSGIFTHSPFPTYEGLWAIGSVSVITDLNDIVQYLAKRPCLEDCDDLQALFQQVLTYIASCAIFQELRQQFHPVITPEQKEERRQKTVELEKRHRELLAKMPEEEAAKWDPNIYVGEIAWLD